MTIHAGKDKAYSSPHSAQYQTTMSTLEMHNKSWCLCGEIK